ncbi:MAG: hypothetical protein WA354_23665 [Terracidiphilus sp.]
MGANELALVACEAVGAGGADLAMVVDGSIFGCFDGAGAGRTALWEITGKFIIKDVGSVGEHG